MAISVTLYKYSGDNRVVDKTSGMTSIGTYSGVQFNDSADLHNPEFILQATVDSDVNYVLISQDDGLGRGARYYFATVENVRTGVTLVSCRLDVLMTYKNLIQGLNVVLERTGDKEEDSNINSYMYDRLQPKQVTVQYTSDVVGGFNYINNGCMIIGVIGASEVRNYQY